MTNQDQSIAKNDIPPEENTSFQQTIDRIEELEALLESEQKKGEEMALLLEEEKERSIRAIADLQNVRRRSEEDRIKAKIDGASDILLAILATIENFSRAFEHLPDHLKEDEWVKGLFSIEKGFCDHLSGLGVEFIDQTSVPVDPSRHEPLSVDPNVPVGTVASLFERGMLFRGKVLKPAKVVVGGKDKDE
jgi:molecular chaperone GrpE